MVERKFGRLDLFLSVVTVAYAAIRLAWLRNVTAHADHWEPAEYAWEVVVVEHDSATDLVAASVKQIIISVLDLPMDVTELDDDLSLYSNAIGLDSLTLLRIITRLEEEIPCKIDDRAMMFAQLVDVGSLVELVSSHIDAGTAARRVEK